MNIADRIQHLRKSKEISQEELADKIGVSRQAVSKWETMTFNVFEMGTEESVQRAFDVLRDGGVVIEAIHELPWSKYCATVIAKYGVCWWIAI